MLLLKIFAVFVALLQLCCCDPCKKNDCSLLSELECALYTTDSNEKRLNQAFFPPRKATSRYITVNYEFEAGNDTDYDAIQQECNVSYIWAVGGFLLIQPPTIFQLSSLLFSYPANNIEEMTIKLPQECRSLIKYNDSTGTCSCSREEDQNLDILTQQIMQYSKFNNPQFIVRDVTSTAQAICIGDLTSGHFEHRNVTLYLAATLVLPVAASVVSSMTLWKYHGLIRNKVECKKRRPQVVGIVMAGIYITMYISSVDTAAIYYFITRKNEYGNYPSIYHSFSLQLTWSTWFVEYVSSILVLLVFWYFCEYKRLIRLIHMTKYSVIRKCTLSLVKKLALILFVLLLIFLMLFSVITRIEHSVGALPLILLLSICNISVPVLLTVFYFSRGYDDFLICFTVIPVIFVSAHMNYILAAWLTEPSKTTSVAILAIALIFYLFFMSRNLYTIIKYSLRKLRIQSEGVVLLCTFALGFLGVGVAALQVAALYTLPIPSIRLADYLDNVFQISLVILAALISYKIIYTDDYEASKFFKMFNKASKKDNLSFKDPPVVKLSKIDATLTARFYLEQIRLSEPQHNEKIEAKLKLDETTLFVTFPRRNANKSIIVPTSVVNLEFATITAREKEVHIPLDTAKLHFKVLSDYKNDLATVSLERATLDDEPISNFELRVFITRGNKARIDTAKSKLAKSSILCDDDDIICKDYMTLSVPLPCYIVKKFLSCCNDGAFCRFDNSVSVAVGNDNKVKSWDDKVIGQVLIPLANSSIDIDQSEDHDDDYFLKIEGGKIHRSHYCATNVPIKLQGHGIDLEYSNTIDRDNIVLSFNVEDGHNCLLIVHRATDRLLVPTEHLSSGFTKIKLKPRPQCGLRKSFTIEEEGHFRKKISDDLFIKYAERNQVQLCTQEGNIVESLTFRDDSPQHIIRLKNACIVCTHKDNGDSQFVVESILPDEHPRSLKVMFKKDDIRTTLKMPCPLRDHKLNLVAKDLENCASSFLFFPSIQSNITQDDFEAAGVTCGKVAFKLAKEDN